MTSNYSLYKEMKRLKSIRGAGTEMISIYIPAGMNLAEESAKLRSEHNQSGNIKSKQTREHVQDAIDKITQYLKLFRETPKNGIAIFCGNVSDNPGKTSIELFSIEPPFPLKVNIYRCDSAFLLDPIEDIIEAKDVYGLLVMDGREATIATLKGSHIQVIKRLKSMAHAKVRKGGQSAQRYERAIEESIDDYYKVIGDVINALFQQYDFKMKGLIIGGPGPAKEGFAKSGVLNYQIKTIGVFDTGYTDEFGLNELLEKAAELLKEQEAGQERKIIERFMQEISRNGLAVYGYKDTKKALESNQASVLIINKEVDTYFVRYKCNTCGADMEALEQGRSRQTKHSCGGNLAMTQAVDVGEELVDLAESKGINVQFVSSESSYGKEFLMGFRGMGALLRYK